MYKTASKNHLRFGKALSLSSGVNVKTKSRRPASRKNRPIGRSASTEESCVSPKVTKVVLKVTKGGLKVTKSSKTIQCESCEDKVRVEDYANHNFEVHHLSTCKFCRELIPKYRFHEHIETVHGRQVFNDWLAAKKNEADLKFIDYRPRNFKKSATVNRTAVEASQLTKEDSVPFKCQNCGQMVDSHLTELHNKRYCRNSVKR